MAGEFGEIKAESSEWQAVIESSSSAVPEKVQAGFGVKRPGQALSSRTDDLTLVYGLFWGYSLPAHMV